MNLDPEFTPDEKFRGEQMFRLLRELNEASLQGNIAGMDRAVSALGKSSLEALLLIAAACLDLDQLQECHRLTLGTSEESPA